MRWGVAGSAVGVWFFHPPSGGLAVAVLVLEGVPPMCSELLGHVLGVRGDGPVWLNHDPERIASPWGLEAGEFRVPASVASKVRVDLCVVWSGPSSVFGIWGLSCLSSWYLMVIFL